MLSPHYVLSREVARTCITFGFNSDVRVRRSQGTRKAPVRKEVGDPLLGHAALTSTAFAGCAVEKSEPVPPDQTACSLITDATRIAVHPSLARRLILSVGVMSHDYDAAFHMYNIGMHVM